MENEKELNPSWQKVDSMGGVLGAAVKDGDMVIPGSYGFLPHRIQKREHYPDQINFSGLVRLSGLEESRVCNVDNESSNYYISQDSFNAGLCWLAIEPKRFSIEEIIETGGLIFRAPCRLSILESSLREEAHLFLDIEAHWAGHMKIRFAYGTQILGDEDSIFGSYDTGEEIFRYWPYKFSQKIYKLSKKREEGQRQNSFGSAQDEASKIVKEAKDKAVQIIKDAESKGEADAAMLIERLKSKAKEKQAAALESTRQKHREATKLKKSAKQIIEAAKLEAQETMAAAQAKSEEAIAAAKIKAKVELQSIKGNAAKLNLEAVVNQLYELHAKGELLGMMERPAIRRLYIALGEIITEAQGFAAPETVAQMTNQNRMDEIKAMNYALAKQIRDVEADEFLPDVVRGRMIEQLLDMAEAKGGSIVKQAVDDG